mmetsp:Transcript_11530/g.39760  ORF Transcript_11530/g.39760 Transcript_11530/m.39760 type:complete len:306 (+) Transcript_11530:6173-7090(+)
MHSRCWCWCWCPFSSPSPSVIFCQVRRHSSHIADRRELAAKLQLIARHGLERELKERALVAEIDEGRPLDRPYSCSLRARNHIVEWDASEEERDQPDDGRASHDALAGTASHEASSLLHDEDGTVGLVGLNDGLTLLELVGRERGQELLQHPPHLLGIQAGGLLLGELSDDGLDQVLEALHVRGQGGAVEARGGDDLPVAEQLNVVLELLYPVAPLVLVDSLCSDVDDPLMHMRKLASDGVERVAGEAESLDLLLSNYIGSSLCGVDEANLPDKFPGFPLSLDLTIRYDLAAPVLDEEHVGPEGP